MEKFESGWNPLFSVILGHTLNVILGFIPRIHAKQNLNCHPRAWRLARPEDLDSRVKPENDHNNLLPQCAPDATGFLSDVYKRGTRVRKAQAVTRQTNECIETAESGVDKVVSCCEKNPNVHKTYINFLRQRKTALDAPLHAVSSGRSMIEMLGVLAIIGVLSVGGIQGFSKAMETYQSHKQLEQINSLIYAALELRDGLIQNYKNAPTTQRYDLMPALSALGYLPDMKLVSNHATDKYGNSFNLNFGVDSCRQPDGTVAFTCFSYRMGIYLKTQGTSFSLSSENQCKNLIKSLTAFDTENSNIGHLELRNMDTENIDGYNVSSIIYGRQNCTNSRQTCFKNMTPIKMTQFCKSCASENLCELYIYFK